MVDVVAKLWGFCNTLRHDGINYGDYIEQLTYLLFLKLADEKDIALPTGCKWSDLKSRQETDILEYYSKMLRLLSNQKGILKDIFEESINKFRYPNNLEKLVGLIDQVDWGSLDIDLKASAYEGLLQKYAVEQKGAGQYFTPRDVIRCVVRCIKPDFRENKDYQIHDPAAGTSGFLTSAHEWIMAETHNGADLTVAEKERLAKSTFSGVEIVQETRRLGLMNLFLHRIVDGIYYGDALIEGPHLNRQYDCIMTNPPFGTKGAGEAPHRKDFTVRTSNKQLNFLQHLITVLKLNGKAAIVLPDNVLFESHAGREVKKRLLTDCNLHTILRLPIGTFSPYSPGVKANILFFNKESSTKELWIYDLRTNMEKITKNHPFTGMHFEAFERCYNEKPRKECERFRKYTLKDIEDRDYNLDIVWLKNSSIEDSEEIESPYNLVSDMISDVEAALNALNDLALKVESTGA